MFILRWLSLIMVVLAVMLMGADVVSTLERGGAIVVRTFGDVVMLFGANAGVWVQAHFPLSLALACQAVLSWPGWLVIGVPGGFIAALVPEERKRRTPPPAPPIDRF